MNVEEMQVETLLDAPIAAAREMMRPDGEQLFISLRSLMRPTRSTRPIATAAEVAFQEYVLRELESGAIELWKHEQAVAPVKPELREIARRLNVDLLGGSGRLLNTRQLGTRVMRTISQLQDSEGLRENV